MPVRVRNMPVRVRNMPVREPLVPYWTSRPYPMAAPETGPYPSSLPGWTFIRNKKKKKPAAQLRKLVGRKAYLEAKNRAEDEIEGGKEEREAREAKAIEDKEADALAAKEADEILQATEQEIIKKKGKDLYEYATMTEEEQMIARAASAVADAAMEQRENREDVHCGENLYKQLVDEWIYQARIRSEAMKELQEDATLSQSLNWAARPGDDATDADADVDSDTEAEDSEAEDNCDDDDGNITDVKDGKKVKDRVKKKRKIGQMSLLAQLRKANCLR